MNSRQLNRVLIHIPLILLAAWSVVPLFFLFINAVKPEDEIQRAPLALPTILEWTNFSRAWETADFGTAIRNSLIVSAATVALICLFGGMAAFALARYKMRGNGLVTSYFLLTMTLPGLLYIVPLFSLFRNLGLTDNLLGIIIIYTAIYMPFSIFLMRSYFLGLPPELEDAARVDGCSEFGLYRYIIMPLSWPIYASVALIVSVYTWNEFLFAITFLHEPEISTVAVSYRSFTGQYVSEFSLISAAGVIMILPGLILFVILQRRFIRGLVAGSVK
jgi:raffinose/stachyose/melibiose transport system permease protein